MRTVLLILFSHFVTFVADYSTVLFPCIIGMMKSKCTKCRALVADMREISREMYLGFSWKSRREEKTRKNQTYLEP
jgi:hypothetical protein